MQGSIKGATNGAGHAVAPQRTANAKAGKFTVVASVAGLPATVTFNLGGASTG